MKTTSSELLELAYVANRAQEIERTLRHHKLKIPALVYLICLADGKEVTMGELAKLSKNSRPATTIACNHIYDSGFIIRRIPENRRNTMVKISAQGVKLLKDLGKTIAVRHRNLSAGEEKTHWSVLAKLMKGEVLP